MPLNPAKTVAFGEAVTTIQNDLTGLSSTTKEKVPVPTNDETIHPAIGSTIDKPHAEIEYGSSYTHNLGDYRSARIHLTLRMPAAVSELNQVFEYTVRWVDDRMQVMIDDVRRSNP